MPDRSTPEVFRSAYAGAFARYLATRDETTLRAAYELGRSAVVDDLSVLDLALVHHDALAGAISRGDPAQAGETTAAGGTFFLESLSAFEMVRRGFRDARDAALAERRHATLLRRLTSFLADASLAAGDSQARQELLQLVAEQALEFVDAEYCLAAASLGSNRPTVAFAAGNAQPQSVPPWVAAAADQHLSGADPEGAERGSRGDRPRNTLAAQLRGLDGRAFGSVQLFDRRAGDFTDVDQAVLDHLAELAAAALERTRLYAEASSPPNAADG